MASAAQNSFSGGEWSPYLSERVDLAKYGTACDTLQNLILTKYGAVRRRPGTQFIAEAKHADKQCRLFKFQFSVTTTFVIEMGDQYLRFFSNGTQVTSGGSAYEVVSPYTEAQLRDVHVAQINDEMRFVHPDHPPYLLRRVADDNWTFAEIEYSQPALRDENLDESLTIQASATTGTGITLTAVGHTFDEDGIGGYYRIGHARETSDVQIQISAANEGSATTGLRVKGDWEIFTAGTWAATVVLQRSVNGGSWETLRSWTGARDRNISATGTEVVDNVKLRIFIQDHTSGGPGGDNPRAVLEVVNSENYGVAKITAVAAGGATATADVVVPLESDTATFKWSEGAWSPHRGYPRTISLHEARLYYGGNAAQAQTIWASDIDGYDRFTEEDLEDSDSFRVTLGGTEFNAIQWISTSPKNLLIGTTGGEWSLSSGDEANLLTGTSVRAVRESELGSEHLQPVTANNVVLFLQKGARDISEIVYSFEQDGFINANLTELAEHITNGGIEEMAYQKHRDSILWAITGNGNLIGLTYVRKQEVVGWHRHTTQGSFESVAVIGANEEEEEIWFSVKRTVNGGTVRYIERFYPDMWRLQESAIVPSELMYVDSGVRVSGSSLTSATASHLYLEPVSILEDGATTPEQTLDANGTATLVNPSDVVMVGLPFTSVLEPTSIETSLDDGTSQGRQKRIHKLIVSVFKTSTFQIGPDTSTLDTVFIRDTEDEMDKAPDLVTKQLSKEMPSRWSADSTVVIVQDQPLPLTVLSLIRNVTIRGHA